MTDVGADVVNVITIINASKYHLFETVFKNQYQGREVEIRQEGCRQEGEIRLRPKHLTETTRTKITAAVGNALQRRLSFTTK